MHGARDPYRRRPRKRPSAAPKRAPANAPAGARVSAPTHAPAGARVAAPTHAAASARTAAPAHATACVRVAAPAHATAGVRAAAPAHAPAGVNIPTVLAALRRSQWETLTAAEAAQRREHPQINSVFYEDYADEAAAFDEECAGKKMRAFLLALAGDSTPTRPVLEGVRDATAPAELRRRSNAELRGMRAALAELNTAAQDLLAELAAIEQALA